MKYLIFSALVLQLMSLRAHALSSIDAPHIRVKLIAEHAQVTPGEQTRVAVHFVPEDGWHVYWRNPGDTGLAPQVHWSLPEGIYAGAPTWAKPHHIPVGPLVNIGFDKDLLLPFIFTISESIQAPKKVEAKVTWLVCKEACIPGNADLNLALGNSAETPSNPALFDKWDAKMPLETPILGSVLDIKEGVLQLDIYAKRRLFDGAKSIEVFMEEPDIVSYQKPKRIIWKRNHLLWHQALNEVFSELPEQVHVVVVVDDAKAFRFTISTTT